MLKTICSRWGLTIKYLLHTKVEYLTSTISPEFALSWERCNFKGRQCRAEGSPMMPKLKPNYPQPKIKI